MKELTVLEQIILVSIISLKENGYGMAIRQRIKSLTGKSLMYGTLYNALDQLYRKGFISKSKNKSPADREHGRVYYTVSPSGSRALESAYRLQKTIWGSVPDLIKNFE